MPACDPGARRLRLFFNLRPARQMVLVLLAGVAAAGIAVLVWGFVTPRNAAQGDLQVVSTQGQRLQECRIAIRSTPLTIDPSGDLAGMVSDDDMRLVLDAARPYWDPPNIALILHAVRLWGADARFPEPGAGIPGVDCGILQKCLLDDDLCLQTVQHSFDHFLTDTRFGVRPTSSSDPVEGNAMAEGHYDQLAQVLGETGVHASTPVRTGSGRMASVREVIQDSLMRFNQTQELEFTAIAYAHWLPPQKSWQNRFGETYTFDDLVQALTAQPLGDGSCRGCHVPYALVCVLRADDLHRVLGDGARRAAESRLREISACLDAAELPAGGWDKTWSGNTVDDDENVFFEFKPQFDQIMCTGHHLEWIALASPELRPSINAIRRAVMSVALDIARLSPVDRQKFKGYLPISHAARAFALMRGTGAFDEWQRLVARDAS